MSIESRTRDRADWLRSIDRLAKESCLLHNIHHPNTVKQKPQSGQRQADGSSSLEAAVKDYFLLEKVRW